MKTVLTSWLGGAFLLNKTRVPGYILEQNGLAEFIRRSWKPASKVLIIAAGPEEYDKNDSVLACLKEGFPMSGMSVSSVEMCDRRTEDLIEKVPETDVLVLSGGHVPTQNEFMRKLRLRERLSDFNGMVLAWSAGSMNCAETVYAGPELPGEALDPDFKRWIPGLGLTKINIFPHFSGLQNEMIDGLRMIEDVTFADSMGHEIIALNDGSYIVCDGGVETLYGDAFRIKDGHVEKICSEGSSTVLTSGTED
ncbi:MAG: Type 1 glutamine amidotransferase-like domain-containing protein [Clostridiales bacterium]|nr:Type 1 glutamine amidotransferase-like domain-containing protein [Clostridiales bacterium]